MPLTNTNIREIIGNNLRYFRTNAGYTQQDLAAHLGITFQQVQKYEWGINRLSADDLYILANFLKIPIAYFFQELQIVNHMQDNETLDFVRSIRAIENKVLRKIILKLITSLDKYDRNKK